MTAPLMSRAAIAKLAEQAALDWIGRPDRVKPANPFSKMEEPEHHAEWEASFSRYLLVHSTDEVSA